MKRSKTVGDLVGLGHYERRRQVWARKKERASLLKFPSSPPSLASPIPPSIPTHGFSVGAASSSSSSSRSSSRNSSTNNNDVAAPRPLRAHVPLQAPPQPSPIGVGEGEIEMLPSPCLPSLPSLTRQHTISVAAEDKATVAAVFSSMAMLKLQSSHSTSSESLATTILPSFCSSSRSSSSLSSLSVPFGLGDTSPSRLSSSSSSSGSSFSSYSTSTARRKRKSHDLDLRYPGDGGAEEIEDEDEEDEEDEEEGGEGNRDGTEDGSEGWAEEGPASYCMGGRGREGGWAHLVDPAEMQVVQEISEDEDEDEEENELWKEDEEEEWKEGGVPSFSPMSIHLLKRGLHARQNMVLPPKRNGRREGIAANVAAPAPVLVVA
ncbi:Hypothetical protein NocV09_01301940 [Nannochloropsis oceanica]